jgi:hypothetical protein
MTSNALYRVFDTASLRPCCLVVRQPCMPCRASWPYSSSTDGHGGQLHIHTCFKDAPFAEVWAADIACGPTAAAVHVSNSKLKGQTAVGAAVQGCLQPPKTGTSQQSIHETGVLYFIYMKPCQSLNRSTDGSIPIRKPAAALQGWQLNHGLQHETTLK